MLTAKKVLNPEAAKKLCDLCGSEYCPEKFYYAIYENDGSVLPEEKEIPTALGVCGFGLKDGKTAVIYDISPKTGTYDLEAMYILGKAVLNFVDLCGIKNAEYAADDLSLAKHLEFSEKDGVLSVSLTDYFTEPCKRHNNSGK